MVIADHALLSDCQSAALVNRAGSVEWWCAPRFDSRSAFARLLDPGAGHWSITPAEEYEAEWAYVPRTMVVRSTFRTARGTVRLTDTLALQPGARGHELGLEVPHALVRLVEGISGEVDLDVDFAPRLEYGLVVPRLVAGGDGIRTAGGPDTLVLRGDAALTVEGGGGRASGRITVRAGQTVGFSLAHALGLDARPAEIPDPARAIEETIRGWESWAETHQRYEGAYAAMVERSAVVLQALTYAPSGAVIAAPTTSLPEIAGGESNWDYRYAWLRDASLTLKALFVAACPDEAGHYFRWMSRAAGGCSDDDRVQVVFGVQGERDLTEHTLDHLSGWRGSTPVRVGNDAWRQRQLDVPGEVLDAAHLLRDQADGFDEVTLEFLRSLADRAARGWSEPDAGIWEGREGERHYTASKLMCWVALDRAVDMADQLGDGVDVDGWSKARDEARRGILEQAWSEQAGAYAGAFGSDELDAAVLLMPLVGFLPADDDRMRRTISAIERDLGRDGLITRWTGADGHAAFLPCCYWLADCLARAGEVDRARAVFDRATACASDLGLLAEVADPTTSELLGNYPQGLTHVGLINAAWSIEQASR